MKKKRLFGILFSLALVLTMMPVLGLSQSAYAANYDSTSEIEDSNLNKGDLLVKGARIINTGKLYIYENGKKYYFKIRPYTNVENPVTEKTEKVYGKWSKVKSCKAKK